MKIGKGFMVASAVASLVLAGGLTAQAEDSKKSESTAVNCAGTNACKGQGGCKGADNACKSQNECKGKGWAEAESAEACTEAGGTVVES
jgi:hypothetical protein